MSIRFAFLGLVLCVSSVAAMGQPAALEQDARVIEILRKNGSDFSKLHSVDYFFVMPTEVSAKAIAAELEASGYLVQNIGIPPKRNAWEVHVQRSQLIQVEVMQATTVKLTELGRRFGGYYDGWGAPVAK